MYKDSLWPIKNKPLSLECGILYIKTLRKKYKGPGAVSLYERSDSLIKKILILPQKKQYYREMLELTFWKISPKGKAFTLIKVPFIAVAAVVIIIVGVMAVAMAVVMAAAVIIAPGKDFGKNPEKSSPRKKGRFPLGLLM